MRNNIYKVRFLLNSGLWQKHLIQKMVFRELVLEVDEDNYDDFLNNGISVLNFFSDWKMDCLMIFPMLEALAEELNGKICFGKVNVEECEKLAEMHRVSKVPCVLIFKNGELVERINNCDSEEFLRERIFCLI